MGTIRDYINWRGDLDLDRDGFNIIDNIVLSCVSYVEMDEIFTEGGPDTLSLKEISDIYFDKIYDKKEFREGSVLKDGPEILKMIADTVRYKSVKVRNYISLNDTERILQFAATECEEGIRSRIINVYSNDGPGFMKELAVSREIKAILPRLVSIVPEDTIVGLLMTPVATPIVVTEQ